MPGTDRGDLTAATGICLVCRREPKGTRCTVIGNHSRHRTKNRWGGWISERIAFCDLSVLSGEGYFTQAPGKHALPGTALCRGRRHTAICPRYHCRVSEDPVGRERRRRTPFRQGSLLMTM